MAHNLRRGFLYQLALARLYIEKVLSSAREAAESVKTILILYEVLEVSTVYGPVDELKLVIDEPFKKKLMDSARKLCIASLYVLLVI